MSDIGGKIGDQIANQQVRAGRQAYRYFCYRAI